jgi:hypothetical protein
VILLSATENTDIFRSFWCYKQPLETVLRAYAEMSLVGYLEMTTTAAEKQYDSKNRNVVVWAIILGYINKYQ